MRATTVTQVVSLACLTLVIGAVGSAAGPAPAHAEKLTLTAREVGALPPAGRGAKVARSALPGGVPPALRRVRMQGAAFRGAGRRLRTGVFVLRGRKPAARALRAAARGMRRLRQVGDGAYTRSRASRSAVTATVALRVGRAVGAIRYTARRALTANGAALAARAYASALAARLRRALTRTAWEKAMDAIRDDGTVSPRLAARVFALAYGSIPGARRPAARVGTPADGTLAIQLAARVWNRLRPNQRRAIERAVGSAPDAALARASQNDLTPDPALQAAADGHAAFFTQRMGVPAPVIEVFTTADELTNGAGDKLNGDAVPVDANGGWGGPMVSCRVRISPLAQKQSLKGLDTTVAHEVFHCFQFTLADFTGLSPWLLEGTATWAAYIAAETDRQTGLGHYLPYIEAPEMHLFGRAYDAVGFWGWAEQTGGADPLWSQMPAILSAGGNGKAFALAGGKDPAFLDGWASASFRYPAAGPAWNQVRPFAVPYTEALPPATVVDADTDLGANAFTLRQFVVLQNQSTPLLRVERVEGRLRAGTTKQDFGPVGQDWFCFGKCACPKGEVSSIPGLRPVGRPYLSLGQTGGADDALARLDYHDPDEFCSKKSSALNVSGATKITISEPGYCVRPFPGVFQVQMPLSDGSKKIAQVVLEISGFTGAGTYPTGPSVATVYDFRKKPAHLWETPVDGEITIKDPGGAAGEGASGSVASATSGTSVELGTTTVEVSGTWSCV